MSSDFGVGEGSQLLNALYHPIAETQSRWSICARVTKILGSTFVLAGSTACNVLYQSLQQVRTITAFSIGASAFSLTHFLCPERYKRVIDQLGLEAIRLGLPLYFLLTQLYLNAQTEEEKQLYLNIMMILFGVQTAVVVRKYATYHFKVQSTQPSQALIPKDKKFVLLGENSLRAKNIKCVVMAMLGGTIYGLSFLAIDPIDKKAIQSCGFFYIGQSAAINLWNRVEILFEQYEAKYQKQLNEQPDGVSLPTTLKVIRVIRRFSPPILFLGTAGLFFKPDPYKTLVIGMLHGIMDERARFDFSKLNIFEMRAIQHRRFSQKGFMVDTAFKVIRLAGEAVGLIWFDVLVFKSKDVVYDAAIGSFSGAVVAGFLPAFIIDRTFKHETNSSLLTTLFYRTLFGTEVLGMPPVFMYLYVLRAGVKIGNDALNSVSVRTGILAFLVWAGFGYNFGQEIAQFESNRYGPEPTRIPKFLGILNTLLFVDLLTHRVS